MLQLLQDITPIKFICTHYTPQKVLRSGRLRYHWHNYFQLLYVRRGSGVLIVQNTEYPLNAGEFMLIWPNEEHAITTRERMDTCELKFSLSDNLTASLPQGLRRPCRDASDAIRQALQQFEADTKTTDAFSRDLAKVSLLRILLLVQRALTPTERTLHESIPSSPDPYLEQLDAYIDANIHRRFTVREMADFFYTEYTHFSRSFSAKYGIRLQQHINQRRVIKARELLATTNLPIAEIAVQCGFETLSNLERNFKAVTGYSPTRHRQYSQDVRTVYYEEDLDIMHNALKKPNE